jgi:tetratricopeptide (TPR) repeat protein
MGSYDLYLRAARLRARLQRDAVFESLELLERALQLDPDFAPALAQAAGCHSQILAGEWTDDPEYHRRQGHALADRALHNCSEDPAVLAQVANALMDLEVHPGSNIDRALGLIARATTLNPGSAFAWFISAVLCMIDGQGDAVGHLQRAMRLDPVSPLHAMARAHLGPALAMRREYAAASAMLRAASNLPARPQLVLACISSEIGELSSARDELRRYEQITSVPAESMVLRMTRHPGQRAMLAAALARIRASG